LKKLISLLFFLFSLIVFSGWLIAFFSESTHCAYSEFLCDIYYNLPIIFPFFIFWNLSFLHSNLLYPEWIAALVNVSLLASSAYVLKKSFKKTAIN